MHWVVIFKSLVLISQNEARNLALLLRAGALPAPVTIIEERQLVQDWVNKIFIWVYFLSKWVWVLVVVFHGALLRRHGFDCRSCVGNEFVLIVALLSLLGATLTLPGIAGIVLTVGMAVDANVLIFERIREELRRGMGVQASIHAGYERAFVTILDANITTLIVMMILFSLGSGVIKGIAITVTIGLIDFHVYCDYGYTRASEFYLRRSCNSNNFNRNLMRWNFLNIIRRLISWPSVNGQRFFPLFYFPFH